MWRTGNSRQVANRLALLLAVPLCLGLGLAAFLTLQFAIHERQSQSLVRHTYQVIAQLNRILGDARDAETAQRGYLLTADPKFLAPFGVGRSQVESDLDLFRAMTRDNPSQQRRARSLDQMIRARLAALDNGLAIGRSQTPLSPALRGALDEGKRHMDALRQEVGRGINEEQLLLAERDRRRRETENLEIAFAIGVGVLTLGILLLAAVMLVRNNIGLAAAERSRASEAALLQATLETVREGIAYFNAAGRLSACNGTFFTMLGLAPELCPLHRASLDELRQTPAGKRTQVFEPPGPAGHAARLTWNGRELDVYKAPVATGGFLIGVVDQTQRVQAENVARQAQKMEAIGHLTGGVAHDFNNLLQIISANLEMAAATATEPRLAERIQNATAAVLRGSRLTAQLLAFARRQPLEPRSVDLGRVIRGMSDMLRRSLGENVEMETVIAGGLWNTLVDPGQVENMLLNLAINARDAMPEGGKLTLEVANAHLDDSYAASHAEVAPGQYVMLAVSDTGTGMPPEVMARVFEPFFSTKPEGKGTGLGLAQAYGFTKQSGGHIKIYSELGHGTTIKIYLPRTRREADAPETAGVASVEGGSEHILVVEDDQDVRNAVADMLGELGYRVSQASDAQAALALLQKEAPDLVFTDVVMPGPLAIREFATQAQALHPGLRILYTSGYTQNAIVHNGKLDDDAQLLSKPYRKEQLARKLRSVLAARAPAAMAAPPAPGGKVLVVEDVALIRETTLDMIDQIGLAACDAADAREALAQLKQDPDITIMLTDLGLPGMSGRELVAEALKLKPGLKVIVASGYAAKDADQVPGAGANLLKPFDIHQLRKVLEA